MTPAQYNEMIRQAEVIEEYKKNLWWGYLHVSGTYLVKRYFGQESIKEAEQSPFVVKVVQPFTAKNRDEALAYIENKTK